MKIYKNGILEATQTVIPVNFEETTIKEVYDIGETVIYIGTAPLGTATSAASWLIKKITLSSGIPTITQWSSNTAIWNNRVSESYN